MRFVLLSFKSALMHSCIATFVLRTEVPRIPPLYAGSYEAVTWQAIGSGGWVCSLLVGSGLGLGQQIHLSGARDRLGTVLHIEFATDLADIPLDSADGQNQVFGNVAVG